jgi:DNA processing protein
MLELLSKKINNVINPVWEIASYEAIWKHQRGVSKVAELFRRLNHALPSYVANKEGISNIEIEEMKETLNGLLPFRKFAALFYGDFEYPKRLADAKNPVELLYYRGSLGLLSSRSIAIVGTRKPTQEGIRRAKKLAQILVDNDFTVMSGLAEGIDTAAHTSAIERGGKTIAVIGTALNETYPKSNIELQNKISEDYLVVSQVPFYQYSRQTYKTNRFFFPERNKTMSALSEATIIVEASETSGTLVQARAALEQGRKLFILKSCFEGNLTWPENFLKRGAVKIEDASQFLEHIQGAFHLFREKNPFR